MEINITGCRDCPFRHTVDLFDYCNCIDGAKKALSINMVDNPDWCPLKVESVIIQFCKNYIDLRSEIIGTL